MSPNISHAADAKYYSGATCKVMDGTDVGWVDYGSNGAVYNYNTTDNYLYIMCPAVMDTDSVSAAWYSARDRHTSDEFACSFRNNGYSGSYYQSNWRYSGSAHTDATTAGQRQLQSRIDDN